MEAGVRLLESCTHLADDLGAIWEVQNFALLVCQLLADATIARVPCQRVRPRRRMAERAGRRTARTHRLSDIHPYRLLQVLGLRCEGNRRAARRAPRAAARQLLLAREQDIVNIKRKLEALVLQHAPCKARFASLQRQADAVEVDTAAEVWTG